MGSNLFASIWRGLFGKEKAMQIRQIDERVSVAGQLSLDDVPRLAEQGYQTVIANRPDSESGAVPHEEMQAAVEAAGLKFHYIPITPGTEDAADIAAMSEALLQAEGKVLAYCRSGARSANLYRLATSSTQKS